MPTKRERANSVEGPANLMKAAGESSKTDPTEFIEQQRQHLKMLEMKRSKLSAQNYEDVNMQDDERTDSATKLNFDDRHFEQTSPNNIERDNIPITDQPGLSSVTPTKMYADFVHIENGEYEELITQYEARNHGMLLTLYPSFVKLFKGYMRSCVFSSEKLALAILLSVFCKQVLQKFVLSFDQCC